MFKPDLAKVLLNKFKDAKTRLSAFEATFGEELAKRNLRVDYLAYFQDALGIPLKRVEEDKQ